MRFDQNDRPLRQQSSHPVAVFRRGAPRPAKPCRPVRPPRNVSPRPQRPEASTATQPKCRQAFGNLGGRFTEPPLHSKNPPFRADSLHRLLARGSRPVAHQKKQVPPQRHLFFHPTYLLFLISSCSLAMKSATGSAPSSPLSRLRTETVPLSTSFSPTISMYGTFLT